jgi:Cyclophilin type peptidyl-prolyl cis-trans isomerase/CLD
VSVSLGVFIVLLSCCGQIEFTVTHDVPMVNCWTGTAFEQKSEKQESFGTVIFHLFDEVVPVTARNFRELCTGQNGFGYKDSLVRRIIPSFLIQAGGFPVEGCFESGQSIYGLNFRGVCFCYFYLIWSLWAIDSGLKCLLQMKILSVDIRSPAFCQWQTRRRTETGRSSIFICLTIGSLTAPVLCLVRWRMGRAWRCCTG